MTKSKIGLKCTKIDNHIYTTSPRLKRPKICVLLAHLSQGLKVSYCDPSSFGVHPAINFFFERHLLNYLSKF